MDWFFYQHIDFFHQIWIWHHHHHHHPSPIDSQLYSFSLSRFIFFSLRTKDFENEQLSCKLSGGFMASYGAIGGYFKNSRCVGSTYLKTLLNDATNRLWSVVCPSLLSYIIQKKKHIKNICYQIDLTCRQWPFWLARWQVSDDTTAKLPLTHSLRTTDLRVNWSLYQAGDD